MAGKVEDAHLSMHIGGEWVDSLSGETFERVSPVTGEVLATLPAANR
jgi:acyl-CoA reductase-like NAD-dependent aldehyde dehydrogenase